MTSVNIDPIMKRKFSYGPHNDQFGHLYRPATDQKLPVMVVIHGGYWQHTTDLDDYPTVAIVEHFQNHNLALWNLEYRRMNVQGDNVTAPWPTVFEDVAAGLDFLYDIEEVANLDLNKVLLIGHSAGGHLAAWANSRDQIKPHSELYRDHFLQPKHTISIAAVLDFDGAHNLSQPHQVERLMGGTKVDWPLRYAASDPTQLAHGQASICLVHGGLDADVPISQAHSYVTHSSNHNLTLEEMPTAGHFGMLPTDEQTAPYWPQLITLINSALAGL